VVSFQASRGLREDGVCGRETWAAVVEAGYRFGDRWLYFTQPMLRGDDIGALQRQLGGLGFDAGRIDGICGPDTQEALEDFQRNAGLTPDGICGPDTMAALRRLGGHCQAAEPVTGIREEEHRRRAGAGLASCRIVVAHQGGLGAVARATARALTQGRATVMVIGYADGAAQARAANSWNADAFVGLGVLAEARGVASAYFRGTHWHSEAGRRLAEHLQQTAVAELPVADLGVRGMSMPALRETKMPAVLCELGPPQVLVEQGAQVAGVVVTAIDAWLRS
jgi:N-acetylmuramoyl-L-alanine amidase